MDMVLTLGRADTDVSEETKGTGNTIMHEETQRKLGGCKILVLNLLSMVIVSYFGCRVFCMEIWFSTSVQVFK